MSTMLVIVFSIAVPLCLVVIILGCLDCLFKKKRFENVTIRDSHLAQHNAAYSAEMSDSSPSSEHVVIEPLPDILTKVSAAPPIRPKITCSERGKHEGTLSLISVQRSFPRKNVIYVNELGSGWFGKVIESEASEIVPGCATSHVVVKMLKDDATKSEQKQFMDEVSAFKCLEHPNLMKVLGQCTEASPYLVILEFAVNDSLKAFLLEHQHEVEALVKKNRLVNFAVDAAAGLACLHRHDYVHNDLAARNCLVMADYTVKIGDYGISDSLYKDEYFNTGREFLPVRWMAPETLLQTDGVWTSQPGDKMSDIWSFGVLLWEIFSLGDRPHNMLTDEAVLEGVVEKVVQLSEIDTKLPYKDRVWSTLNQCWQGPGQRPDVETVHQQLEQLNRVRVDTIDVVSDFDKKWSQLGPGQVRTSSADSDLGSNRALAGSFATDNSSSPSDKPSSLDGETAADVVVLNIKDADVTNDHKQIAEKENIADSHSSKVQDPELSLIQQNEQKPISHDQITVENEVTKASISSKSVTPVRPTTHPALATSTPVFQGAQSASTSTTSSPSSAYVTANEAFPSTGLKDDSKALSMLGNDSLDSELSFHELTDTTLQTSSIHSEQSNQGKGEDVTNPEVAPVEEDDFSEFVRTSPTAPTTDFTDFESAAFASTPAKVETTTADNQRGGAVGFSAAAEEAGSRNSSGSEFEFVSSAVPDDPHEQKDLAETLLAESHEKPETSSSTGVFGENAAVSNSSNNAVGQIALGMDTTSSQDSGLQSDIFSMKPTVSEINKESDINKDIKPESLTSEVIERTPEETESVNPNAEEPSPPKPSGDKQDTMSLGSALDVVSLDSNLDVISLDSAANVESAGEMSPKAEAPVSPSLKSDPSIIGDDIFSSEPRPAIQSTPMKAFTDLQDPPSFVPGMEPVQISVPTVKDVLEENKADLLSALNDSSNAFSTLDVGDHPSSSDLSPTPGQLDAGIPADQEKVGTPSKSQSENAESDINNHSLTESPTNHVIGIDSYSMNLISDSLNQDESNSSTQSVHVPPDTGEFRHSNLGSPHRSSLYRCSNIHLTENIPMAGMFASVSSTTDQTCQEDLPRDVPSPTSSDTGSSSTSGSGQEYICSGPSDTGQPPPSPTHSSFSHPDLIQSSVENETSPADFDELALQIASEIYLSRGLKSPRVFEIPPLETIPEHTPMPSIQEETNHTPSDTSSLEVRYDDLFGSDAYEWDDFFGDPLIGRDMGIGHQQRSENQLIQQSSYRDIDVSDWSLELESDSGPSSSSLLSRLSDDSPTNISTQSDFVHPLHEDMPTDSGKTVHYLSDSELVKPTHRQTTNSSKQTLVSSLLSQLPNLTAVTTPDPSDFYSLVEAEETETDISLVGEVSSSSAAISSTTESLSYTSTSTSLSPSLPASSPHTPSSPPACQITDLPNDFDIAVSLEPSMGSGLLSSSQDPEIQQEKSSTAANVSDDLLGLDFGMSTSSPEQPAPVDNQQKSQAEEAKGSDPFGDLLGEISSSPSQDPQKELQQDSTSGQTAENSLIDF